MGRRHGSRTVYTLLVLRTQPAGTPRHTGRACDQVPVDSPQDAAMPPTTGFDQGGPGGDRTLDPRIKSPYELVCQRVS